MSVLAKVVNQPDLAKELLRNIYKQSLFKTAKNLLGYKDMTEYTHARITDALQDDTKRKLIVLPRGTFKSKIVSISYPIWLLINNPNHRILLDSELYSNSRNFLREIKAHMESPKITSLFGEFRSEINWTEGSITVKQRSKVQAEASITCSGVGSVKVGQHYTVIIGDDYNSDKNSATREGREKVIDHYKMNQALLEPEGIYVLVATRYAADDIPGYIMSNEITDGFL